MLQIVTEAFTASAKKNSLLQDSDRYVDSDGLFAGLIYTDTQTAPEAREQHTAQFARSLYYFVPYALFLSSSTKVFK